MTSTGYLMNTTRRNHTIIIQDVWTHYSRIDGNAWREGSLRDGHTKTQEARRNFI